MEETTGKVDSEETSELDAIKLANERLLSELKTAGEKIAGLEKAIAGKDAEIESVKQSLEENQRLLEDREKSLTAAVAAYKELAAQANPGPVAEMIKGDTIGEIKESVANARALVEKVKQEIGAENARVRVPAGARWLGGFKRVVGQASDALEQVGQ